MTRMPVSIPPIYDYRTNLAFFGAVYYRPHEIMNRTKFNPLEHPRT